MKTFNRIIVVLVGVFLIYSCQKKQVMVDKIIDDVLILSNSSITIPDSGSAREVRVTTNLEDYEITPSESWIKFNINEDILSISAEVNEDETPRSGNIVVTAGSKSETVKVTQEAKKIDAAYLTIEGIDFVLVEGGSFLMGAQNNNENEPNYNPSNYNANQSPVHKVNLSDFYIGKFQITQSQWEAVMGDNPSANTGAGKGNYPVEYVDYDMAVLFCKKLSQQTGQNFRLPTEAEWEYAARGGQKSLGYIYSGSDDPDEVGNFSHNTEERDTHATTEVGSFKPNELGIYDMSGNVYEWVGDYFGDYSDDEQTDPIGPASGTRRIIRGASWWHYQTSVYFRGNNTANYTGTSPNAGLTGFRIVYDPSAPSDEITVDDIDFIKVDGGTFKMGSQNDNPDEDNYNTENYNANQSPVHDVTLSDFYIGKFQVTQDQWMEIMDSNPSKNSGEGKGDFPVEYVDYEMALDFINKLNQKTGKTFRLPTEAEWEFAARGGNLSKGYLYSGSNDPDEVGNFSHSGTDERNTNATTKVGSFSPNELGVYDMSGNVYEWCGDTFGNYPSEAQTNPTGSETGTKKVIRGGSWWHYKTSIYWRGNADTDYTGTSPNAGLTGFRLVYVP